MPTDTSIAANSAQNGPANPLGLYRVCGCTSIEAKKMTARNTTITRYGSSWNGRFPGSA